MEYYVYILESENTGQLYIGQSCEPDKRLNDHNRGASRFTKDKGPWKRIYLKEFSNLSEALIFERKLKSWRNPIRVREMIARESHG